MAAPPRLRWLRVAAALVAVTARADEDDPCGCLSWRQLYASDRVFCGEGLEFHVLEGALGYDLPGISFIETNFKQVYDQFCTTFLKRLDARYCINVGMQAYGAQVLAAAQWCYVSSACAELNGGRAVPEKPRLPRDVSWKACVPGRDRRLRDLPPAELLELAARLGAEAGHVTKLAYPRLMPPNHTWADVAAAVAAGDEGAMPPALRAAIQARVPIVIDEDPGAQGNQKIVHGREVYELVNATGWPYQRGRDVGEL